MFQVPGYPAAHDWLQFSICLGRNQSGSNYNARHFHYPKSTTQAASCDWCCPSLHQNTYTAQTDRHVYNRWYRYDQQGYCCPRIIVNPDLAIVTRSMPILYGEVESSNLSNVKVLDRINQATARILSYTNKCFLVCANLFYIQLYH